MLGLISSIPGVLVGIELGGIKTSAAFLAATGIAVLVGAQPFYSSVKKKLRLRGVPWLQYLGIVVISYLLFGCVMAFYVVLSKESVSIGWPLFGVLFGSWALFSCFAAMLTGWLAVPLGIWASFRLARSNNPVHATCEDAGA